jgi:hypothetical protein
MARWRPFDSGCVVSRRHAWQQSRFNEVHESAYFRTRGAIRRKDGPKIQRRQRPVLQHGLDGMGGIREKRGSEWLAPAPSPSPNDRDISTLPELPTRR